MNSFPYFLFTFKDDILEKQLVVVAKGRDYVGRCINVVCPDPTPMTIGKNKVFTQSVSAIHLEDVDGNPTFVNTNDIQSVKIVRGIEEVMRDDS